jgi:hypothetical protein
MPLQQLRLRPRLGLTIGGATCAKNASFATPPARRPSGARSSVRYGGDKAAPDQIDRHRAPRKRRKHPLGTTLESG